MGDPEYYPLAEEHIEAAAQIYTRAFFNDNLFKYLLPKEKSRKKALYHLFKPTVAFNIKYGEIYGIGTPLQGVATWKTPGVKKKPTLRGVMQCGFGRMLISPFVLTMVRGIGLGKKSKEMHKKIAPGDHFYLEMLSVDPNSHGQGWSSKLVKPMMAIAKERGLPVYLETSNPRNVAIYEHFGLTMVEKFAVGGTKLDLWAIYRKM